MSLKKDIDVFISKLHWCHTKEKCGMTTYEVFTFFENFIEGCKRYNRCFSFQEPLYKGLKEIYDGVDEIPNVRKFVDLIEESIVRCPGNYQSIDFRKDARSSVSSMIVICLEGVFVDGFGSLETVLRIFRSAIYARQKTRGGQVTDCNQVAMLQAEITRLRKKVSKLEGKRDKIFDLVVSAS